MNSWKLQAKFVDKVLKGEIMTVTEEHECEVVVPHCKYEICTDYPHCAGCGAAEWTVIKEEDDE